MSIPNFGEGPETLGFDLSRGAANLRECSGLGAIKGVKSS